MAISDQLPVVTVAVTVDGAALPEYEDTAARKERKSVARYIEAQSNKYFAVKIVTKRGYLRGAGYEYQILMDGQPSACLLTDRSDVRHKDHVWIQKGQDIGPSGLLEYKFADVKTTERGDAPPGAAQKYKDLGVIEVRVFHLSKIEKYQAKLKPAPAPETTTSVHEAALKGRNVSHSIGHGQKVARAPRDEYFNVKYFDPNSIAIFKFHYRSRDALQAQLLIPRSPPLEGRDPRDMTIEEIRHMQRRIKSFKEDQAAQAAANKIKREPEEETVDRGDRVKIKREPEDEDPVPAKRMRRSKEAEVFGSEPGEIVIKREEDVWRLFGCQ